VLPTQRLILYFQFLLKAELFPVVCEGLVIEWSDGEKGVYPFPYLRQHCPCALCKGESTPLDPSPLNLPSIKNLPPEAYEARDLFKVGRYAIGIKWGDGHETGIYTFDYLRKIISSAR
jgi:DUF971 family protein